MARARSRQNGTPQGGVAGTALDIFKEFLRLLGTEFRLLRAELGEKAGVIGLGIGLAARGALLPIAAVVLLFVAVIGALIEHGFGLTAATFDRFRRRPDHGGPVPLVWHPATPSRKPDAQQDDRAEGLRIDLAGELTWPNEAMP